MEMSFLEEEEICGFHVDSNRKKLWKIELDILQEVIRICNKYNIRYFLHSGSALGAVRHQGFIPWDDDLDIGMLREDFEKFLTVSKNEIKEPLFLQHGMNDGGHICGLLRIRHSDTTGIIKIDRNKKCNNGVFIEIYPFDNVPDNEFKKKLQCFESRLFYHGLLAAYYGPMSKPQVFLCFLIRLIGIKRSYSLWQNICKRYNNLPCKYVDTVALPDYENEGIYKLERSWITNLKTVKFEYLDVLIPEKSDEMLTLNYGDYMELPPKEERGMLHRKIVFYDPNKPYTYYIGKKELEDYFS